MENKQQLVKTEYFDPAVWQQMKTMAETFIISKALPSYLTNAPQVIMTMQVGYEMGMKPMEAIKSLYLVNGQFTIWGAACVRRLREHGWTVQYKMLLDRGGGCEATVTNKVTGETFTDSYYFDAAVKSGYTRSKDNSLKVGWKEGVNRELKLRYGVISKIIKTYIPEVLDSVQDIAEVAEDYPVQDYEIDEENKTAKPSRKPSETIVSQDSEQRKSSLSDFLKKEKAKTKEAAIEVSQEQSDSEPKKPNTEEKEQEVNHA